MTDFGRKAGDMYKLVYDPNADGVIAKAQTEAQPLNVQSYATDETLDVEDCIDATIYLTAEANLTLPPVFSPARVRVVALSANALTITPEADEYLVVDGVEYAMGEAILSPGDLADECLLTFQESGKWYASLNFTGLRYGFTTYNPADKHANITLSESDLLASSSTGAMRVVRCLYPKTTGKWYIEFSQITTIGGIDMAYMGVCVLAKPLDDFIGSLATGWGCRTNDGKKLTNGSSYAYAPAFVANDIMQMWVDLVNGKIWWGKNDVIPPPGPPPPGPPPAFPGFSGTLSPAMSIQAAGVQPGSVRMNNGSPGFTYDLRTGYEPWRGYA